MTYEEARFFIDQSNQYGSKLGLETVTELLRRLGNPQEQLKIIHVAGTNGKGSTTAYIASILAAQGYRTGRFISPAVFSYRERVQITVKAGDHISTDFITEAGVSKTIDMIKPACEAMVRDGFAHPTSFEIETAMAFLYLLKEQVDFAVIEVGLGGRLDATNVISKPLVSIITSISMDHMQYLGDTLSKIASEKAGIIKQGSPVVTGNTQAEVWQVIKDTCERHNSRLFPAFSDEATEFLYSPEGTSFRYQGEEYVISLLGEHQVNNALLAIQTAEVLKISGYIVSRGAVKYGLSKTKWSGRFEVLSKYPYFIIDGAHNEDAAIQLRRAIELYFSDRRLIYIVGVLADKDYSGILRITAPYADTIITVTPDNPRALDSTSLAEEARKYCNGTVVDIGDIAKAVQFARAQANKEDVIIAFGSLSYLSEILNCNEI